MKPTGTALRPGGLPSALGGIDVTDNWPISERHVHLQGGLLAINPPQSEKISLWPTTTDNKNLELKLATYASFYSKLKALKLEIIGVEFITHEGEAIGSSPPQWRPYAEQKKIWVNWDAFQLWGQLGNSAYSHKNGLFYDLSKRIAYQLSSLSERLKELSLAYRAQLNALWIKGNPELGGRFQDGFTELTYQKFQSFLFDAYSGEREHSFRLNVNTFFLNALPTEGCTSGVHVQSIS